MKRYSFSLALAFLTLLLSRVGPACAWPSVYPTGTTLYEPDKAFNAYLLFSTMGRLDEGKPGAGETPPLSLINMSGQVVHQWHLDFRPLHARLLPNGNIVVLGRSSNEDPSKPGLFLKDRMGGFCDWLVELTWEGKQVVKHVDLNMHHDFARLPNGNYLYLAWEVVPPALKAKVRGGIKGSGHNLTQARQIMFNDYLVEVTPQGQKVWEWHANQHLDPDIDIIGPHYKREEWLHLNSVAALKNGNILVTSRSTDAIMVIDKKTGRIIFRWGNTAYLDKTTGRIEYRINPDKQPSPLPFIQTGRNFDSLGGPHDAQQIPSGYPGAGNFTCYDNGMYVDFSRVIEIDPLTGKVVWSSPQPGSGSSLGRKHFANFMGGAQRLPNGNTLVCEGINGRFFQLTRNNEKVWEYINPDTRSFRFNGSVFKVHAYAPDYCPQFKNLPSAQGPAVTPIDVSQFQVNAAGQPLSPNNRSLNNALIAALSTLLLLSVALNLFLCWRRRKENLQG